MTRSKFSIVSILTRSSAQRSTDGQWPTSGHDKVGFDVIEIGRSTPTQAALPQQQHRHQRPGEEEPHSQRLLAISTASDVAANGGGAALRAVATTTISAAAQGLSEAIARLPQTTATPAMGSARANAPAADHAPSNDGLFSPLSQTARSELPRFTESERCLQPYAGPDPFSDASTNIDSPQSVVQPVMPAVFEPAQPSSPVLLSQTALPSPFSLPNMRKASNLPLPAYPTPSTPWQQAVNGASPLSNNAGTGGKTSQVIEKLTLEAERLRRELRAERAAKEEAVQEALAMKARIQKLEEQNGTLSLQCSVNDSALARKERRLDDLRTRVEHEESRRKDAEQQASIIARELEDTVTRTRQEVSEAKTKEKYAEAAYTTIRQEYEALEGRIKHLRSGIDVFQKAMDEQRQAHAAHVTRLEVLLDQQRQRQEASDKTVAEMSTLIRSYQQTEENVKSLESEMATTVREMKWVMQLHKARGE